jgi:hypothetical protein
MHKRFKYLQSILNQKLFRKDIKNALEQGLDLEDWELTN